MKNVNIFTTMLEEIIIAGEDSDFKSLFIIMELMPQDLRKLMSNKQLAFDEDHALTVLYNILCGINFLHSANIIHRDLKPANILINNSCEIKICDFGMSRTFVSRKQSDNSD